MTRGTVREIERERKSACESVEPKTQTNRSSNKAQEITNIKINKFIYIRCNL